MDIDSRQKRAADVPAERYFSALFRRAVAFIRSQTFAFYFVLTVIYVAVSGAAFIGYYEKWTMSDGIPSQSLVSLLDGNADRPYVYRQLLPAIANVIEDSLQESVRIKLTTRLANAQGALTPPSGVDANKAGYVLRYRIVYYLTFLSLFLAMFVLRSVCRAIGVGEAAAAAAPAIFVLIMPILQTRGGYFYDYSELLAFSLAVRVALAGRIWALLLLAVPATLNKESYFFFVLTLLPLLLNKLTFQKAIIGQAGSAIVSGATYVVIHELYAHNAGSTAIFQLFQHLVFYANPLNLFLVDRTYGVPLFKGYSIIVFAWFGILAAYGWSRVPTCISRHLQIAAAINVPLFLLFCAEGEMRNLSMLFVGIVAVMAAAIQRWLETAHAVSSGK